MPSFFRTLNYLHYLFYYFPDRPYIAEYLENEDGLDGLFKLIFQEKATGGRWERPKLHRLLGQLYDEASLKWWCKLLNLVAWNLFGLWPLQSKNTGVALSLKAVLLMGLLKLSRACYKRLARGFRSLRFFCIIAYLKASNLLLNLPSFYLLSLARHLNYLCI